MGLNTKVPNVTFDERVVGASDSRTRKLTQTVTKVLALITSDARVPNVLSFELAWIVRGLSPQRRSNGLLVQAEP